MRPRVDTQEGAIVSALRLTDRSSSAMSAAAMPLAPQPALAELYRRHASDVGRWAARLGGPRIDVDDVVQEVFIVVSRRLAAFRGEARITTWLFRITDRVVRNHRRWWAVRRIVTRLTDRHRDQLRARDDDPLEALERRAAAGQAYRVLDRLPEKCRRVLILSELEELPPEEIARLLDARIETVRVWLHRARRMFLQKIQELDPDQEPQEP
jgi:RNA polymerase sigma-70 factor (ECF subfamily)